MRRKTRMATNFTLEKNDIHRKMETVKQMWPTGILMGFQTHANAFKFSYTKGSVNTKTTYSDNRPSTVIGEKRRYRRKVLFSRTCIFVHSYEPKFKTHFSTCLRFTHLFSSKSRSSISSWPSFFFALRLSTNGNVQS